MARGTSSSLLRPTVLDRLLQPAGTRAHPAIGLRELKAAVARDLEALLNTTSLFGNEQALDGLEEARRSILTYGIPDFSNASWRSESDARRICREIASAVRVFEPRLLPASVRVVIQDANAATEMKLRFRIEGTLRVEPISEPVSFDSDIETGSGAIHVDGSS